MRLFILSDFLFFSFTFSAPSVFNLSSNKRSKLDAIHKRFACDILCRYGHPRFYNYLSLHKPPPGSDWAYWYDSYWGSKEEGLLSIYGAAISNWSFTDGSVKSIELPLGGYRRLAPVKEYFYI